MAKKSKGFEKTILAVTFNVETGLYNIGACKGSSVPEMAFGVMALIKTLVRDGMISSYQEFLDLVNKYLNDPQFGELK